MNEFVRGFRSQRGIRRQHWKDVEVHIEIKRCGFRPPVPIASTANLRGGNNGRNVRDYIRTLCEWLGASRKDPDRLDSHGSIEPDSSELRTTGRLEGAPFQQHGGRPWPRERVWGLGDRGLVSVSLVSAGPDEAAFGSRGTTSSPKYHNPHRHFETVSPFNSLSVLG